MTSKTVFSVYDTERSNREFKLPGQQKVIFEKDPRYGFWSVHFQKGPMPAVLKGQFSTFKECYDRTNQYLKTRSHERCEIGEEL